MRLAVEVDRGKGPEPVEVGLELDPDDVPRVAGLVGMDALQELARGEWNPDAGKAIVYVNLVRVLADGDTDWLPPFKFSEMMLDWGPMTGLIEPDAELEETLADISEAVG